jgi:hypothetical protein
MKKLSLDQRIALLIAYTVEHAKDPTSVGTMRALRALQAEYMVDLYLARPFCEHTGKICPGSAKDGCMCL